MRAITVSAATLGWLMWLTTAFAIAQAAPRGEISGVVTDKEGGTIPGARVRITTVDQSREAVTNKDGRFVFEALTLGPYRVVIELAGFLPTAGNIDLTAARPRSYLAWQIEVGCLEHVDRVMFRVREGVRSAGAIIHARVVSTDGPLVVSDRPECPGRVLHEYSVQILDSFLTRIPSEVGKTTARIRLLPHESSLSSQSEFIALLSPDLIVMETLVFPVVSGRVSSPAAGELNGLSVENAMETLRRWSRERRK